MPLPQTIMGRRVGEVQSHTITEFFRAKGPAQTPPAVKAPDQTPSAVKALDQTPLSVMALEQTPLAVKAPAQPPPAIKVTGQTPPAVKPPDQTPSVLEAAAQPPSAIKALDQTPSAVMAPDQTPSVLETAAQPPPAVKAADQTPLVHETRELVTQFGRPSFAMTLTVPGSDDTKTTDTTIEERLKDYFNLSATQIGELITSAGNLRPHFDPTIPHNEVVVKFFAGEITGMLDSKDDEVANTARAVISCFPTEHWAMALEERTGELLKKYLGRDHPPTTEEWKLLPPADTRLVGIYLGILEIPEKYQQAGTYKYAGSATGEDGLLGRVKSHKRWVTQKARNKAPRIDVLRDDHPGSVDTWVSLLEIEGSDKETDLTTRMCNKILAILGEAIYSTLLSTWFNVEKKRAGIWGRDKVYWKGTNFAPPLSQFCVTVASFPKGLAAARKSKKEAEKRAKKKASMTKEELDAESVKRREKRKADMASWSPEKLAEHKAYNKRKFAERQAKMTPEQRQEWLAKERERAKKYRNDPS